MDRVRNQRRSLGLGAMTAAEFNVRFPEGQPVVYTPVRGMEASLPPLTTQTRSEAWELGDGTPVVLVRGKSGGVALSHLDLPAGAWECSQHGRSAEACCERATRPEPP